VPHILLGLNVIAFTSLFSAFFFGMRESRSPIRPWARFYFYCLLGLAAWALFYTVDYYLETYVASRQTSLENRIDALIVLFLSSAVIFSFLHFVEHLLNEKPRRFFRLVSGASLAAYALLFVAFIVLQAPLAETYLLLTSFLGLCLFSSFALFRGRKTIARGQKRGYKPFLIASLLFFPAFLAEYFLFHFSRAAFPPFPKGMLSLPVYCITVSAFALARGLRRGRPRAEDIPESFLVDFGITGREKQIISCLFQGDHSKKISARLCISPRTVGNHLNNIYRKCGVSGRLELLRLIREDRFS
jgi:DNA-binding CsgD family transcriptional regulator